MPKDRVQPLKLEDPGSGGVETDSFPTACDPSEDYIDAHGMTLQSATSDDEAVYIDRDNTTDDLLFADKVAGGPFTLTELLAGEGGLTEEAHRTLRQLIHFLESGPGEGFASGAYCETTGTVFPTAIVWYEDGTKAKKIVERLVTWVGGKATVDKWKSYDVDGSTVLWTISDAITYSGPFEASRTRTITAGDA